VSSRSLEFLIPGDLQAPTGGYGYDRNVVSGLTALGWRVTVHALDGSFPFPSVTALEHARHVMEHLPDDALVMIDGLAGGVIPDLLHAHARRLRLVALVHHPLAYESGLSPEVAAEFTNSERRGLQAMRHAVVTSRATQSALREYGVELKDSSVVEPGTDPAPLARRERGAEVQLVCVATLTPRKGHDLLFEALVPLRTRRWHLTCIGSLERSPQTVAQLREQLERAGLTDRVTLSGELEASVLGRYYANADVFVSASRHEGYGMAVAEALAYGVPVISTAVGAIPELVGRDAGILVAPDDVVGLGRALLRVLDEPAQLEACSAAAATRRATLPSWPQACALMAETLQFARGLPPHAPTG
jgi:glycosyltransferase involved in cell wall biosynthesis